ncbi:MAG: c-type cytochrome biogenesis protein CcmI [Gammaproteobacteria bacterium]|nr:c-type cytochrome biogenesis protein CcmI [Gammaproteobacteria bacterium]MBI5615884.1 c-type cytochrome biogenesis protein CcmI [Gammaproteobacteria bacterium]
MAAALWFVIPPLLVSRHGVEQSRRDINMALYRDKLAELEADKARGTLSVDQFDQARADLERQLLQDLLSDQTSIAPVAKLRPRGLAQTLAIALPMSAVAFYLGHGSRDAPVEQAVATAPAAAAATPAVAAMAKGMMGGAPAIGGPAMGAGDKKAMPMEEAVARLKERLDKNPTDGEGWLLLGNSYRFLGKSDEAKAAFDKAAALGKEVPPAKAGPAPATGAAPAPDATAQIALLEKDLAAKPDDAAGWDKLGRLHQQRKDYDAAIAAFEHAVKLDDKNADWLADAADAQAAKAKSLEGEPLQLIERALAANPKHVKALWLAASAARARGDKPAEIKSWTTLHDELEPGSADERMVAANLAEAKGEKPPAAATPATDSASVKGSVSVDSGLAGDVKGDETVFIFARAVTGPPMPLAVLRKQARDLPLEFTLDDTMAIMPALKLSSAREVVVGARISKTGNAMPQPGDLEGLSGKVSIGDGAPVRIVIDHRT